MLEKLGIEQELYDYTSQYSSSQPERDMQLIKGSVDAEYKVRTRDKGKHYTPLERDIVLKHIEAIENKKSGFMVDALVAVELGEMGQEEIPFIESCAKIWAEDQYSLEKDDQVDSSDIIIAFHKYDLQNDPEFHSIMQQTEMTINEQVELALQSVYNGEV